MAPIVNASNPDLRAFTRRGGKLIIYQGAPSFDTQPKLEKWVERGEAPERVIALNPDSKEPLSRPLCA